MAKDSGGLRRIVEDCVGSRRIAEDLLIFVNVLMCFKFILSFAYFVSFSFLFLLFSFVLFCFGLFVVTFTPFFHSCTDVVCIVVAGRCA